MMNNKIIAILLSQRTSNRCNSVVFCHNSNKKLPVALLSIDLNVQGFVARAAPVAPNVSRTRSARPGAPPNVKAGYGPRRYTTSWKVLNLSYMPEQTPDLIRRTHPDKSPTNKILTDNGPTEKSPNVLFSGRTVRLYSTLRLPFINILFLVLR